MYIFMPILWFPTLMWCGFNDAPFTALAATAVLGYLEVRWQQFVDWLRVTDLEQWAVDSMRVWEAYVIYKADIDQCRTGAIDRHVNIIMVERK